MIAAVLRSDRAGDGQIISPPRSRRRIHFVYRPSPPPTYRVRVARPPAGWVQKRSSPEVVEPLSPNCPSRFPAGEAQKEIQSRTEGFVHFRAVTGRDMNRHVPLPAGRGAFDGAGLP